MENSYFRSYIRRYACTPEEIINALKKSGEHKQQILHEVRAGAVDYTNSGEFNNSEDEIMVLKACPPGNDQFRCLNGGTCLASELIKFCRCAPGWEGRHCEYLKHDGLYEAARVAPEAQSLAPVIMLLIVLIGLVLAFGLLYVSRT